MNPIFSAVYSSMTPAESNARAGMRLAGAEVQNGMPSMPLDARELRPEKWLRAIEAGDASLGEVPEQFRTPELCLKAVVKNGMNLKHVPRELKTKELCKEAMRSDPAAAKYAPAKYRKGAKSAARRGARAFMAIMAAIAAEAERRNEKKRRKLAEEKLAAWTKMMKDARDDADELARRAAMEHARQEAEKQSERMPFGMQVLSYVSAAKDFLVDALKRNKTVNRLFGPFERDPAGPCASAFAAAAEPLSAAPVHGGVPDMLSSLASDRQAEQREQEEELRGMHRPAPQGGRNGFSSIG